MRLYSKGDVVRAADGKSYRVVRVLNTTEGGGQLLQVKPHSLWRQAVEWLTGPVITAAAPAPPAAADTALSAPAAAAQPLG